MASRAMTAEKMKRS